MVLRGDVDAAGLDGPGRGEREDGLVVAAVAELGAKARKRRQLAALQTRSEEGEATDVHAVGLHAGGETELCEDGRARVSEP